MAMPWLILLILSNKKLLGLDRIYRILRLVFSQFPDETEKGVFQERPYYHVASSIAFLLSRMGSYPSYDDTLLLFFRKSRRYLSCSSC
jgi:hypothetical protein